MIVSWCNGSTAVFGSACPSSNLGETTNQKRLKFRNEFQPLFLCGLMLVFYKYFL